MDLDHMTTEDAPPPPPAVGPSVPYADRAPRAQAPAAPRPPRPRRSRSRAEEENAPPPAWPARGQRQARGGAVAGPGEMDPMLDPFFGGQGGMDPMDLLGRPESSSVIRVKRVRCNGGEEASDENGFAGIVARVVGFEEEVQRRWGGGDYVAITTKNGRPHEGGFTIGGDSLPLHKAHEPGGEGEEGEGEETYDFSDLGGDYRYRGRGGRFADDDPLESAYGSRFRQRTFGRQGGFGQQGGFGGGFGQQGGFGGGFGQQGGGGGGGGGFGQHGGFGFGGFGQQFQPQPQQQFGQQFQPQFGQQFQPQQQFGQQFGQQFPQPQANPYHNAAAQAGGVPSPNGLVPPRYAIATQAEEMTDRERERERERDEQLDSLRTAIEAAQQEAQQAREEAAQEREERRLDAERSAAEKREMEMKREMDLMRDAQVRRDEEFRRELADARRETERNMQAMLEQIKSSSAPQGPSMGDRLMEMQMANMSRDQQRAEAARMEREQRSREEAQVRREDAERREKEWLRSNEAQNMARAETQRREELRREGDKQREEQRRQQSDSHYQQLMQMTVNQQQKPGDMLGMLEKVIALRPEKDTFEEIQKLAGVAMLVKDVIGGGDAAPPAEDKWSSIIRTGSEALGRAIGDIQARRGAAEQQQQQQYQQQQYQQQQQQQHGGPPRQLPAPQQHQQQHAPQAMNPATQEAGMGEWGRILAFVVDAHDNGNDTETVATHLHTMVTVGMQRPRAIEALADATVDDLALKLSAMLMNPEVARSAFKPKIDRLLDILNKEMTAVEKADDNVPLHGREWVEELLECLAEIQGAVKEAVEEATGAASREQAPEEFASQSRGQQEATVDAKAIAETEGLDPAAFAAQSRGDEEAAAPEGNPRAGGWT